jgi:hypothetical protein
MMDEVASVYKGVGITRSYPIFLLGKRLLHGFFLAGFVAEIEFALEDIAELR